MKISFEKLPGIFRIGNTGRISLKLSGKPAGFLQSCFEEEYLQEEIKKLYFYP